MTCKFISIYWTGETDDNTIKALRSQQMKNFHLALMISQVMYLKDNFMCLVSCTCNMFLSCHKLNDYCSQ